MKINVPLVTHLNGDSFPNLPRTTRMALLLPTARWNTTAKSLLGALTGIANEEIAVLVADNSDNEEKYEFLNKLKTINPYVITVRHKKNIGAENNFIFLHEWCKNIEFSAIMGDDDWVSPDYYIDAYNYIKDNKNISCVSVGSSLMSLGHHQICDISQNSMCGNAVQERLQSWSCESARITMYNTSRREFLNSAVNYLKLSPLKGLTLLEDLWELSRLACGDFINNPGAGVFIHYPNHSQNISRFYGLLCEPCGLKRPMLYFMALSTALQCAIFLRGRLSPIDSQNDRIICSQLVFKTIFLNSFLPKVTNNAACEEIVSLLSPYPAVLDGFYMYCDPDSAEEMRFNNDIIKWFITLIKVFETNNFDGSLAVSEKFENFVNDILSDC